MRGFLNALTDTFRASVTTLAVNKLRSVLTLLGIVVGVVAVVAMAATTTGLRRAVNRDLEMLGAGVFQVQKWPQGFGPRNRAKFEKRKNFTLADVQLLQLHCERCLRVAGEAWEGGQKITTAERPSRNASQVAGGTAEFFDNNGYAVAAGRFFTEGEAMSGADVVVLGSDVYDLLFPGENALGKIVRVRNRPFRVIGLIERRGSQLDRSIDNLAVIPISAFHMMFGTKQSLNITIQSRDPEKMGAAQDEVISLLRKARGTPPEEENDFELFSNSSMQESFDEISGSIALGTILITAVALLIGGIGVMNIMLVSVTERTREIGIRRALGARRRRILGQFILEAVMLTSIGGFLGLAMGTFLAFLIDIFSGLPTAVPAWAVVASILTAAITGLVFGIYPAYRASRLDPVEAMRHE